MADRDVKLRVLFTTRNSQLLVTPSRFRPSIGTPVPNDMAGPSTTEWQPDAQPKSREKACPHCLGHSRQHRRRRRDVSSHRPASARLVDGLCSSRTQSYAACRRRPSPPSCRRENRRPPPSSAAVCLRCARSFISASLFAVPDQSCSRSGGGGEAVRHCGVVLHLVNPPAPVTRLPASRRCRRRRNFLAVRLPGPSSCLVFLATAAKSSACARDAPRIRPRLSKSTRTAEIKIDAPARGVHLEPNAATSAFRDAGRDKVP